MVEKLRKRRMTIYKWIGKKSENDLEEVVIYTKEIKEKKERRVKKYLPNLSDDLLENLCMFYLFASEAFNA